MSKGTIFLAPGQRQEVIDGIKSRGFEAEVDSTLEVDVSFGTPVMKSVMIELKEVPSDLVSSLRASGRLSRQMIALGANEGPSIFMKIGEPEFAWRYDPTNGSRHYELINPKQQGPHRYTGVTYGELQLRELTLAMTGIWPMTVPSWDLVAETLCEFYVQFQKKEHHSHLLRPNFAGAGIMESWPKPNEGDLILHIFQGFSKMGLKKAKDAWKFSGTFRNFAAMGAIDEGKFYQKIPGIGKATAIQIERQMVAKYEDYYK